ncbi:MAG: ribbon-helix-helix domain-containing protein [Nanoarchaeota archaeon]|nr:ribbon-helix-helix domain-containing protein [Nanoarchaeota archaeon]
MERITKRIPEKYLKKIDMLIESGVYPSRSEFIREAITYEFNERFSNILKKVEKSNI